MVFFLVHQPKFVDNALMPLITISPSLRLSLLISIFFVLGGLALMISSFGWLIKFVIFIMYVKVCRTFFKHSLFLSQKQSIIAFWKQTHEFWSLQMVNGHVIHGYLNKTSVVTRFLMVLSFQDGYGLRHTLLLMPDSIGYQTYRKLLVFIYHSEPYQAKWKKNA